jgi:hypothetical protein
VSPSSAPLARPLPLPSASSPPAAAPPSPDATSARSSPAAHALASADDPCDDAVDVSLCQWARTSGAPARVPRGSARANTLRAPPASLRPPPGTPPVFFAMPASLGGAGGPPYALMPYPLPPHHPHAGGPPMWHGTAPMWVPQQEAMGAAAMHHHGAPACHFWAQGRCAKGAACRFWHGYAEAPPLAHQMPVFVPVAPPPPPPPPPLAPVVLVPVAVAPPAAPLPMAPMAPMAAAAAAVPPPVAQIPARPAPPPGAKVCWFWLRSKSGCTRPTCQYKHTLA